MHRTIPSITLSLALSLFTACGAAPTGSADDGVSQSLDRQEDASEQDKEGEGEFTAPRNPEEAAAYRAFLDREHRVRIPEHAIVDDRAHLTFEVPGARPITVGLWVGDGNSGTYSFRLSTAALGAPDIDLVAAQTSPEAVADALATEARFQDGFCGTGEGGGDVMRGAVQLTDEDGETRSVVVTLRNDTTPDISGEVSVLDTQCSATAGADADALGDEKVWCISWPSEKCFFDKTKNDCNMDKCELTVASLIKVAAQSNVTFPASALVNPAADVLGGLLAEAGVRVDGKCRQTWLSLLFIDIWIGCTCVIVEL